jgi:hypothetical protein
MKDASKQTPSLRHSTGSHRGCNGGHEVYCSHYNSNLEEQTLLLNQVAKRIFVARIYRAIILCILVLLIPASSCLGWGATGHIYANNLAIDCLPGALTPLYQANRAWITRHSVDPDEWRRDNFAAESPRHFIDLDVDGLEAARTYPEEYWIAAGLVGKDKLDKNGTLPWRIAEYYGKLVRAFRSRNPLAVVEISTWLGHYVSDAHVPFHATANYDGQLTGQRGIHVRFEVRLLDQLIKPGDLKAKPASIVKNPVTAAFQWVHASLGYCAEILEADKRALQQDAGYGYNYYSDFAMSARPVAIQCLEQSAHDTASLWMSAWVEAGRPEFPAVDLHASDPPDKPARDPDLPTVKPSPARADNVQ